MAAQGTRRSANGVEVFQYLEGLKISPTAINAKGENALHYVVKKPGQAALVQYFISKGADANLQDKEGNTPFMNAAASGDVSTVSMLLPTVKNINLKNVEGASALALAVKSNAAEVVKVLLDKNADINFIDSKGNNLVYYLFAGYGPRQADAFNAKMELLQNKKLNFAAPQKDGNTVYHLAVAANSLPLVERINGVGVDINAKNAEGFTALHKAAMISKNDAILKYLLDKGAKKNIETSFNETAFDLAKENESFTKANIAVDFLK